MRLRCSTITPPRADPDGEASAARSAGTSADLPSCTRGTRPGIHGGARCESRYRFDAELSGVPAPRSLSRARDDHRIGGGLDRLAAQAGVDLRELGPEEQDERGVVDPDQEHHEGAGRAVGGADARTPEIEADEELADAEQHCGHDAAEPGVPPGDA